MSRCWIRRVSVLFPLVLLVFFHNAYGYVDPGTTSAVFGILAPLLSILLVFFGFLIRPFRKLLKSVIDRFREHPTPENDEQPIFEGDRDKTRD
jgi:hypothetical protein